jgi:DHA1 family tetracycline resistance protein-like MFS transporter
MADETSNPRQQIAEQIPSSGSSPNPIMAEPQLVTADTAFPPGQPSGRRAAAAFIFLTVTLDMLALGMIAPVLPRLIEGFLNGDTSSAAKMLGLFGTVFAAIYGGFLVKPVVAKIGERGAITFGLIGGAIGYSMIGSSKTGLLPRI